MLIGLSYSSQETIEKLKAQEEQLRAQVSEKDTKISAMASIKVTRAFRMRATHKVANHLTSSLKWGKSGHFFLK